MGRQITGSRDEDVPALVRVAPRAELRHSRLQHLMRMEAGILAQYRMRERSRDRGGGYGEAAARALPNAVQVADRWHLMENASAAFLKAVRRSMRAIRTAIGATTLNPH